MKGNEQYGQALFLGKGSFGSVYRVKETDTGKLFACKVADGAGRKYLEKEAMLLSELKHPLFPFYKEAWESGEKMFLCMEYVPGDILETFVQRRGKISEETMIRIVAELAEGLALLHKRGYVFRDLKPENVLIRQDGRVKLLDFGCICRAEETCDNLAGTPGFSAPEQFETGYPRTVMDVYALGRIMQYMLLGGELESGWKKCKCRRRTRKMVDYCTKMEINTRLPSMEVLLHMLHGIKIQSNYWIKRDIWKRGENK